MTAPTRFEKVEMFLTAIADSVTREGLMAAVAEEVERAKMLCLEREILAVEAARAEGIAQGRNQKTCVEGHMAEALFCSPCITAAKAQGRREMAREVLEKLLNESWTSCGGILTIAGVQRLREWLESEARENSA